MAISKDEKLNQVEELEEVTTETKEEDVEELKAFEGDVLSALLNAADFGKESYLMRIIRGNTIVLQFHIHPLSEEEYNKCREKNTKYVRNKRIGTQVPEKTNAVRFRSQLIYTATDEEDRKNIWNNKQAWEKLDVASGVDLIDKVLKSGEKDEIISQIDKISGYDDSQLEETVKN